MAKPSLFLMDPQYPTSFLGPVVASAKYGSSAGVTVYTRDRAGRETTPG